MPAFTFKEALSDIRRDRPLIYLWTLYWPIGRTDTYVGKSKRGSKRAVDEYKRNVQRIIEGRPYRKSKPDGFRLVHRSMAECLRCGGHLQIRYLKNPDGCLNAAERSAIQKIRPTLNGVSRHRPRG